MAMSLEKPAAAPAWIDDVEFDDGDLGAPGGRGRWRRRIAAVIVLVAVIAAAVWFLKPFGTTAATQLVTGQATTGTIVSSVSVSGAVASSVIDELSFTATGTVTEVAVAVGDHVTTGQVLATIDDAALNVEIENAQASLAAAQARLDADQAGPTADTIAQAKDSISQAQLQLSTAKQSLSDTKAQNAFNIAEAKAQLAAATDQLAADEATLAAGDPQIAKDQAAVTSAQASLDSTNLKATQSLHQAENQVSAASLGVTTAQHNYALKVAPATDAQIAADTASVAQAQLNLANLQATGPTITSPIDGTVTAVNLTVGQTVSGSSGTSAGSSGTSAGQIEVMDLAHLQIAGEASETDIAKLKMGQAATITASTLGTDTVVGTVCELSIVGSQISGVTSFPVTVCLDGSNPALLVGMSATAAIVTDRADNAVMVPSLAVKTVGGQQVVAVLGSDGKTQTNVPVTVGISNGSETQIVSGLSGGETVVESVQTTTSQTRGFGGGGVRVLGGGGFGG